MIENTTYPVCHVGADEPMFRRESGPSAHAGNGKAEEKSRNSSKQTIENEDSHA